MEITTKRQKINAEHAAWAVVAMAVMTTTIEVEFEQMSCGGSQDSGPRVARERRRRRRSGESGSSNRGEETYEANRDYEIRGKVVVVQSNVGRAGSLGRWGHPGRRRGLAARQVVP